METIRRDLYLQKLIDRRENGSIKVITGIRRCGKSYLLFSIYREYLLADGVDESQILRIPLDAEEFEDLLDRKALSAYIRERIDDQRIYYIFLDEVQLCDGFEKVLNSLNRNENLDIYVTGSNSKFLSSDILTEFRGRGDEVRVYPLSFSEFLPACKGDRSTAWKDYFTYGGLPMILSRRNDELKSKYLIDLFEKTYKADIVDRNHLRGDNVMDALINMLASSVGSLTNPTRLSRAFGSNGISVTDKTLHVYIGHLLDAFLISKAERYDIKGKRYIATPSKYYFTDIGLRNARLNFRQQEENHIMENIIYNELLVRGFNVDVGIVEKTYQGENGKAARTQYEVDFVCNKGNQRYYVQSAFMIPDREKMQQETNSFRFIPDSFRKLVIVRDDIKLWRTEEGYTVMGILDFLLDPNSLDK